MDRPQNLKMKIKKGDRVQVLTGKDRGKQGIVLSVRPKAGTVIVEGVNTVRKHQKAVKQGMQAGIIDKDMPLPAANVAVISPSDGKPTRIGYKFNDDGAKVRVCKRTGAELA